MSEHEIVPGQVAVRGAGNLEVWARSLPAIEELNHLSIPVIVLKSLPQVEALYGDVAGRWSGDVDLLVSGTRMYEALRAVRRLGWDFQESSRRWEFLSDMHGPERAAEMQPWHLVRSTSRGASIIDLHGDSMPRRFAPTLDAQVWKRARSVSGDGITYLTLSPEDRLLLLCWHFFAHSIGNGLAWEKLRDVELALLQGDALDWGYIGRRAVASGTTLFTHFACELCLRRSGNAVTPRWRQYVPLASPRRLALLHWVLSSHSERMDSRDRAIFVLLGHDHLAETLPAWREMLVPSRLSVAADHLGRWPTWREYLLALARIYRRRIAKTVGRP